MGALTLFLEGLIPKPYLRYVKIIEVGIIGYFFIQVVSEAIYRITRDYFQTNANAIKSFVRITTAIRLAAIILSYLSDYPSVASITTCSRLDACLCFADSYG